MKIVIDIPEEMYKEYMSIKLAREDGRGIVDNLLKAIKKGTPLLIGRGTYGMWGGACEDAISREEVIKLLEKEDWADTVTGVLALPPVQPHPCEDMGEISDGYHTFNQLYHQRAILFATIVKQNKDKAWKSFKHSDGHYCFDKDGEWFIVGVDTPQGSYTYHYSKDYWDVFDCQELECGKEWDGHTEKDVVRLLSLEPQRKPGHWLWKLASNGWADHICSECGFKENTDIHVRLNWKFCPKCGAEMEVTNG